MQVSVLSLLERFNFPVQRDYRDYRQFHAVLDSPRLGIISSARVCNWLSGTVNPALPQFKQTNIRGKTKRWGLSRLPGPGKWRAISAVNSVCLSDPHALHSTCISLGPNNKAAVKSALA